MRQCFSHQITITGLSAVGTSSTIKALKELLSEGVYRFVSGGGIMRARIKDSDHPTMTIEEYAAYCRDNLHLDIDRVLDGDINTLGTHNFGVLESRLGHITWPGAFHVLLECPTDIRIARRAKQNELDIDIVNAMVLKRDRDDIARYTELYGAQCIWTKEQYDLVLDSSVLSPSEIANHILVEHAKWVSLQPSVITTMHHPDFKLDMSTFKIE